MPSVAVFRVCDRKLILTAELYIYFLRRLRVEIYHRLRQKASRRITGREIEDREEHRRYAEDNHQCFYNAPYDEFSHTISPFRNAGRLTAAPLCIII